MGQHVGMLTELKTVACMEEGSGRGPSMVAGLIMSGGGIQQDIYVMCMRSICARSSVEYNRPPLCMRRGAQLIRLE